MEQMTVFEADEILTQIADLEAKIKAVETERDAFIEIYQNKIMRAVELCEQKTVGDRQQIAILTEELRRFAADNLPENKKSIRLPSGSMAFKKQQPKFYIGETEVGGGNKQLIEFCKAVAPEFVKQKIVETADWAELKKHLTIEDDKVFFADTGELIDGLTAQEFPDKFTITTA